MNPATLVWLLIAGLAYLGSAAHRAWRDPRP